MKTKKHTKNNTTTKLALCAGAAALAALAPQAHAQSAGPQSTDQQTGAERHFDGG